MSEGTFRFYVAALKVPLQNDAETGMAGGEDLSPEAREKLPVVLDLSEVEALFAVTENIKHKAILMMTYSSGLRMSETARLKITDIDSKRMMVKVQRGQRRQRSLLHFVSNGP